MLPSTIFKLLLLITGIYGIDYEDNDLAKVCRPIDRQLDLLFVLDGSGSVSGSTFETQMQMLNRIVEMVDIGPKKTQIAVMQYSSYTRVEFGFATYQDKDSLKVALSKIRHLSGTTKTGKALDKALHLFRHDGISGARRDQEDVAQVAVVVTDGHSHDDPVPAAQRLRQAGVQILTLGIGAHINMGELFDITGDETLAFQNLTSQGSLDEFVNQFKKIAVGELCKFARGAHGAEIICNSDSIDIRVSTVNPFYGHLYVVNQFSNPECVANASTVSTEIHLRLSLTACNIQRQLMLNPKGAMFETVVVLKFHPSYNTDKDKVFNVQCFYPEKTAKLPERLVDNRIAISDSNYSVKMPCSYKITSRSSDQCFLEDTRVGETVIHSWECDKSIFDTYQSVLVHSCVLSDVIAGNNETIIDKNGCSTDLSVLDSPDYVEPLTAFAVGKAVKFPDSSLVQFHCQLRFCDRLLGECDEILPPKCNRKRKLSLEEDRTTANSDLIRVKKQSGFAVDVKAFEADDDDSEYDEIVTKTTTTTSTPLVTFASQLLERKGPPHRRRPVSVVAVQPDFRTPTRDVQLFPLDTENLFHQKPRLTKPVTHVSVKPLPKKARLNGYERVIEIPEGGVDVKLNTQDVAIINVPSEKSHRKQDVESVAHKPGTTISHRTINPHTLSKVDDDVAHSMFTATAQQHHHTLSDVTSGLSRISRTKAATRLSSVTQTKPHHPATISTGLTTPATVSKLIPSSARSDTLDENKRYSELFKQFSAVEEGLAGEVTSVASGNSDDPFQSTDDQAIVSTKLYHDKKEPVEPEPEIDPAVKLETSIADKLRSDEMCVDSQVITVRNLEIMQDPVKAHKWCKTA